MELEIRRCRADQVANVGKASGNKVHALKADRTDSTAMNDPTALLEKSHGRVDVLFANAGVN